MRNMPNNSPEDMQKMQQDAIKRAKDMQSKARMNTDTVKMEGQHNMNSPQKETTQECPKHNEHQHEKPHENQCECEHEHEHVHEKKHSPPPSQQKNGIIPNVFDAIMKDSERNLILLLILLLVEEDGDISIILALMYLII